MRKFSLRARLTLIILVPLMAVALVVGLWQLGNARATADDVFRRALLSAALAVSNDVAISDGDALSQRTRDILARSLGGTVFYHVYAPDGVIVAGYATPPVGIPRTGLEMSEPTFFDAIYLGRAVTGVRLQTRTEIEGFAGLFTTTVWQDSAQRAGFVRALVLRTLSVAAILLATVALIVWFGVRIGLRPLLDIEAAIAQRSGNDLSPIRRAVPQEVSGIVERLNLLFGQVSGSMAAQSEFIANAAHQLRNPIAGVLALAESVLSAKTPDQAQQRASDLVGAAQKTAALSQQLLTLERAESFRHNLPLQPLDLRDVVREVEKMDPRLTVSLPSDPVPVQGDAVLLGEALSNLIDNALSHGGEDLSRIDLSLTQADGQARLTITDNGQGIAPEQIDAAMARFVHLAETGKSGLGLSIVKAIVEGHQGQFSVVPAYPGLKAEISLPVGSKL